MGEARTSVICNREILLKEPTDGQLAALVKFADLARRDTDRSLIAVARMMDVLEALVVNEVDREFLELQLVQGNLKLEELFGALAIFTEKQAPKTGPQKRARARRAN